MTEDTNTVTNIPRISRICFMSLRMNTQCYQLMFSCKKLINRPPVEFFGFHLFECCFIFILNSPPFNTVVYFFQSTVFFLNCIFTHK